MCAHPTDDEIHDAATAIADTPDSEDFELGMDTAERVIKALDEAGFAIKRKRSDR